MDLKGFNPAQSEALLDLAVLTMYADGHLSAAEDERLNRLLVAMGFTTDYARANAYDAAVARTTRKSADLAGLESRARTLAQTFTANDQCRLVYGFLQDLVASDGKVTPPESRVLAVVRDEMKIAG